MKDRKIGKNSIQQEIEMSFSKSLNNECLHDTWRITFLANASRFYFALISFLRCFFRGHIRHVITINFTADDSSTCQL